MFDALISGRMRGAAQLRTATNGSTYATFRVAVPTKNGDSLLCSCVTFSKTVIDTVQALDEGDSVAVTGEAGISTWNNATDGAVRTGLEMMVHGAMTAYHMGRKRKAAGAAAEHPEGQI